MCSYLCVCLFCMYISVSASIESYKRKRMNEWINTKRKRDIQIERYRSTYIQIARLKIDVRFAVPLFDWCSLVLHLSLSFSPSKNKTTSVSLLLLLKKCLSLYLALVQSSVFTSSFLYLFHLLFFLSSSSPHLPSSYSFLYSMCLILSTRWIRYERCSR